MALTDRQGTLEALAQTSVAQDEALLQDGETDFQVRQAIQYRLGLKQALVRMGHDGF